MWWSVSRSRGCLSLKSTTWVGKGAVSYSTIAVSAAACVDPTLRDTQALLRKGVRRMYLFIQNIIRTHVLCISSTAYPMIPQDDLAYLLKSQNQSAGKPQHHSSWTVSSSHQQTAIQAQTTFAPKASRWKKPEPIAKGGNRSRISKRHLSSAHAIASSS